MDLGVLPFTESELAILVESTGAPKGQPGWTYSDIRTRLYPAALSRLRSLTGRSGSTTFKPSPAP